MDTSAGPASAVAFGAVADTSGQPDRPATDSTGAASDPTPRAGPGGTSTEAASEPSPGAAATVGAASGDVTPDDVTPGGTSTGIPADRVPGVAILGIVLFALAWFAKPAAILVAWPFLFVVPGWLLVARVVPRLGPAGRLGVGIVASTYVAAHLGNVLGLVAGGFNRPVAIATAVVLAAASLVLATARLPGLAPPPAFDPRRALAALRRERVPFLVAAVATIGVGGILASSAWHEIPGGWVSGGWNWSDFLVHVGIGQSLVEGNFPPQVPYFAGVPLTYHWFADFHGAIAASVAGLHVIPVFFVSSGLLAGALALVTWELALRLMGSRRAATIATLLLFLAGGMGWVRLLSDVAGGAAPLDLIRSTSYDNTWTEGWPFFKIASVLGTGLLSHRATTFGLPGLLSVILLVRVSLGRRPSGMALAGILAALLAPFQFYFFPATYLLVGLYGVARRAWRRRGWLRDATLFLAPVVLALPFILGPALLQRERGAIRFVVGWAEAPFRDGLPAVAFFYATNIGLPLLLGFLALVVSRPPGRAFLAAWAVVLFLVPNLVVASAVEFDMNKYFQVMAVALALLGGWLLRRRRILVVAAVIAASAISPVLVASWHVLSGSVALDTGREHAAEWIALHTPQRAIFVTDAFINSPVDFAGRLRITTFGPYAANLGYDPAPREADVRAAYCDGPDAAADVMGRYGATYVLSSGGLPDCADGELTDFSTSPRFETVYDAEGVMIWHLLG